ncbi:MAG: excinuclease ABC subunit UvrA, partial [Rickettsiales bacterium]|nr:excinuclease ABC subunit UvrA [Rickettsiales bacterium]
TGIIYVLDEPSIGLHQKDNDKLIDTLKALRNKDNTVIVVEHDEDTMKAADYIIDMGPLAGVHGGEIVAQGTIKDIEKSKESLTGQFLSGKLTIPVPKKTRKGNGKFLSLYGASEHNLKNVDISIPLNTMTCVTGPSGSGKSTLILETLCKAIEKNFLKSHIEVGKYKSIEGLGNIDKLIEIDQSPIGRTPRSNPATYTGVFTNIRDWFAGLPQAKARGYGPGRFSFNVKGGRCEHCQGDGVLKIEMNFLPDVYVECDTCKGKRYNRETLEVKFKDKSIADVLDMSIDEAVLFFENVPSIANKLKYLQEVGLGYIKLGQSATTLSGGEAQRVKLAKELSKRSTGKTLYVLDEPTTGLHFYDVKKLLEVLHRLVDQGNSMIIIEHNLDVIKTADYIIDLGPDGGDKGGYIMATGTPSEIVKNKNSITGEFLKKVMKS